MIFMFCLILMLAHSSNKIFAKEMMEILIEKINFESITEQYISYIVEFKNHIMN